MPEDNMYLRGSVWWLRATVNGREYRESLRCSNLKDARKARDKRLSEIEKAVRHGIARHTWEEAVAQWAEHATGQLGFSTLERYAVSLGMVRSLLGGVDVSKIEGKTIQSLIQARRRNGASPATVRRDLTAISQVLNHAEQLGWREGNPTLSKRRLLKERRDPISLPASADITIMLKTSSPRFSALISAALMTGCRQDELCSLTWKQFDAKKGTLEVIGKGNKRRVIQLGEDACRHIARHTRTLGSELIFCNESGGKWVNPAARFCDLRKKVARRNPDFRPFRFHDLRHLFAVEALRGGMSIYRLQKHLGHTSIGVTEIYLAFLTPEEAEAAKANAA